MAFSSQFSLQATAEELQKVVGKANQAPSGLDIFQPTQKKALKAAYLFDLPEDGSTICLRKE